MIRRRKKLVRPDVQLRVILIAFSVASLVLFAVSNLTLSAIWTVSAEWGSGAMGFALEELKASLIKRFLISGSLAIPLSLALGVVFSFKFAGPLYRFKRFFSDLKDGRWDARCRLRKGDDLQDICDSINEALQSMEDVLSENRGILREARDVLRSAALAADGDHQARTEALDRRIGDALCELERRLPGPRSSTPSDSSDQDTCLLPESPIVEESVPTA